VRRKPAAGARARAGRLPASNALKRAGTLTSHTGRSSSVERFPPCAPTCVCGTGGARARKRPLKDIKALMGMLTISIMAEPMSDRDFWRHVVQPRYGTLPGRPRRLHVRGLLHGRGSAARGLFEGMLRGRW